MLRREGPPWGAGRLAYDPATRRRVRRAGARARPFLLPLALLAAAVVLASSRTPVVDPVVPPAVVAVPEGLVLVAVHLDDTAVLPLAVPGRRVDVYAAAGWDALDPLTGASPTSADLVVRRGLVVEPPPPGGAPPAAAVGAAGVDSSSATLRDGWDGAGGPRGSGALTLAVTPVEAASLAARPGGAFLVAVRGDAAPVTGASP